MARSIAVRRPGERESVVTERGDYPDFFADGFSLTAGPFGTVLTLTQTQPTGEPGNHQDPTEIVGRVRLTPPLAKAIADAFTQIAAQAAAMNSQQPGAQKH
jgi:hypothetical protein